MGLNTGNRFVLFWSILGAAGFIFIWNLPWRFQVNDDVIMMWLVSGAYTGEPESYAVFIHPILSWLFSELYTLNPDFNWYGFTWFFVLALSFFLVISRLSTSSSQPLVRHFLAIFFLVMIIHLCIFPQFTLVSGLAAFASFLQLFSNDGKRPAWLAIIGFFLFTLACLIRWESVVLVGLGFSLFHLSWHSWEILRTKIPVLLVLLLVFSGLLIGKIRWEKQSEYADFLRFSKIRSGVIDHPVFRSEVVDMKLEPDSDFFYFSRWFFEGENPTEKELLEKKKALDSQLFTFHQVLNSFSRLWDFQKIEAFKSFLSVLIVGLYFYCVGTKNRKYLRFAIWVVFFLIFNHFFSVQSRVSFLFILCFLFPVFDTQELNIDKRILYLGYAVVILAIGYHFNNFLAEAKGRSIMGEEFSQIQSSRNGSVPLIFEGYQEHNFAIHYSYLSPVPFISTGWVSRSEFQKKALKRFGFEKFEDISQYSLLTPSTNTEIVFPDYMNHAFGDFIQVDSLRTTNFILLHFTKNSQSDRH
jgi:hypothetical protein